MSRAREVFGRDGNFIRARNTDDLDALNLGAPQFRLGRPQHRIHVTRVVARGDDGKSAAGGPDFMRLNLAKHRGGIKPRTGADEHEKFGIVIRLGMVNSPLKKQQPTPAGS